MSTTATTTASRRKRKPKPPEGTIVGMEGHPMSSLGELVLKTTDGEVKIPCERRQTNEALLACFGEVSVVGKKIWYRVDSIGVLEMIGAAK